VHFFTFLLLHFLSIFYFTLPFLFSFSHFSPFLLLFSFNTFILFMFYLYAWRSCNEGGKLRCWQLVVLLRRRLPVVVMELVVVMEPVVVVPAVML
jgi:hypothetical protein